MIRFALKCTDGHEFESWFRSGAAFDSLKNGGHVTCPECGSSDVHKALMAPNVKPARNAAQVSQHAQEGHETPEGSGEKRPPGGPLRAPRNSAEERIAALRRHVEENSEYVGLNFASEARRIHSGESQERAIYGEARIEEARALVDEGVPVAPLPFMPARKAN